MEPIEGLLRIADGTAGPETLRWFRERLTAYLTDRNRPTLEKAFDLSSAGPGKPSERTRYMKEIRDFLLSDAFEIVAPGERVMASCAKLAEEVRRFERIMWPRWRDLREPPAGSSELLRILFRAKHTGQPLPDTSQGIYQALFQRPEKIKTTRFLF